MRATSLSRTIEPSGLARTTICRTPPGMQTALGADGVGEFLARGGAGSPPIWPAGLTVFCCCTALTISGTVMSSLASWSGLTQMRMAYWPAPKTSTLAMPGTRVNWSLQVDVGVIGQEYARRRSPWANRGRDQHEGRGGRLLHRDARSCARRRGAGLRPGNTASGRRI